MKGIFDWKGVELSAGVRVKMIGLDHLYGDYLTKFFFKYNIYGTVCSDRDHDRYWCPGMATLVSFLAAPEIKTLHCKQVSTSVLEVIPEDEYEKYDKFAKEGKDVVEQQKLAFKAILELPKPTINFNHRTFNYLDKCILNTNTNTIELGFWDKSDGRNTFHVHKSNHNHSCCSFTKTTADLQIYIPKIWLNYYGYLLYDLIEWLQFLTKCEIGFEYEFLGEVELSEEFAKNLTTNPEAIENMKNDDRANDQYEYNFHVGESASTVLPIGKQGYYCVRFKASDNKHQTYLRFICLRYIYNNQYWSIPGHAMQIKKALGEEVSYWQALLMAHLHYQYEGYYSFGSQLDCNPFSEHTPYKDKQNPFSNANNYNRHLYPFQDVNVVLERVRTGIGANLSMEYICDAYSRKELDSFFTKKDYVGLYLYLIQKEEKKDEKQWRVLQPLKEQK